MNFKHPLEGKVKSPLLFNHHLEEEEEKNPEVPDQVLVELLVICHLKKVSKLVTSPLSQDTSSLRTNCR